MSDRKIPVFEPPQPVEGEPTSVFWKRFMAELSRYVEETSRTIEGGTI